MNEPQGGFPLRVRLNPHSRAGTLGRALSVALAVAFMLFVLGAAVLGLAGCRAPRTIVVQGEAPPPTVVTRTDSIYIASPPDTTFLPPDTVRVTETVPVEVIRYLEPRPDTARAARVWRLSVDSADVRLALRSEDLRLRAPHPGETLTCVARSPDRLDCRVEGTPARPPAVTVECPGCPECIVTRSWGGRIKASLALLLVLALGAGVGWVARTLLR